MGGSPGQATAIKQEASVESSQTESTEESLKPEIPTKTKAQYVRAMVNKSSIKRLPRVSRRPAATLNKALSDYLGDDWNNTYEQNTVPDDISVFAETIKVAFGTRVVPVTPTGQRFNQSNGIYIKSDPKTVYANTEANTGFINVVLLVPSSSRP